jgi:hypothetical protein
VDPFELSRSPYLNDLIQAARAARDDPSKENQRALAERLKFMAEFTEMLVRTYAGSLKVRPNTPLARQVRPVIEKNFNALKDALRLVNRWFTEGRPEQLEKGCSAARQAVEALFESFEQLRQEEEKMPIFSSSPYVHELVRVALGVASGEFPAEALKEKLDWMRERWRTFRKDFEEWCRAPAESPAVEQLLPQARAPLDQMGQALDEMALYFADRKKEHLKKGCEGLIASSEKLISAHEKIVAAVSVVRCPRCGAENPAGSRLCGSCSAVLPTLPRGPQSTVEVAEGPRRPSFTHLARLENAVEAALQGSADPAQLRQTVEWFAQKARQGRRQFEAMPLPDSYPSEELRMASERARGLMDKGTRRLIEGVERLESYFKDPQRSHLEEGLALVREGADLIFEAQEQARNAGAVSS